MRANNQCYGLVSEWLCRGLQILPRGFDSLPDLQLTICNSEYHMRLVDLFLTEAKLNQLQFMGSTCTKDCSGHPAGYYCRLDRGGKQPSPLSPSLSFRKGAAFSAKVRVARPQGGGKFAQYLSQKPSAFSKRQQRAQAKMSQPAALPVNT